ncbi:sugar transferase [Roseibacterium beibuensis]|uniref:sugar transferase n=1 Tax=[Roseibacterium] beibuensis TaxID=1193142 RepID=UPI00217EA96A|nr:sugar transferase [Roseibacterium beibuensis]MCS6623212.1 sugar transferase [Roseibacterium beibuensis]
MKYSNEVSNFSSIGGRADIGMAGDGVLRQRVLSPSERRHHPIHLPRNDLGYRVLSRSFDLLVGTVALVLLLPLFAVFSVLIKLSSPGPVFFRQDRYGLNGDLFKIYKFRTMRTDQCDVSGVAQTTKNDPRVTKVGRLLRKTSFDELPQIFNILKGEMSVVGPRPHVPGMLANGMLYEEFDPRYMARHVVKPGLTGLAQVNGFRGETSTAHAARKRLDYDLEYIQRQSLLLDVKITAQTFWKEFFRGSGY